MNTDMNGYANKLEVVPGRTRFIVAALLGSAVSLLLLTESAAQPTPPDFTGVWQRQDAPAEGADTPPPLTPEGQRLYERNLEAIANKDPELVPQLRCLPAGFPRFAEGESPFYFLQTPEVIGLVGGSGGRPQIIHMEDDHQDLWPRYMGDSIGRWEGDTLIVEVTEITTKNYLNDGGLPLSEELRVVERFRLLDHDTLQNEVTFEDPKILTKPWVVTFIYERHDELKPVERVCENLRLRP